jgi:hypothetical protein
LSSNWIVVSNLFPFHLKILEPCYMNCFKVLNFVLQDTVGEAFMTTPISEEVEISGYTSSHLISILTLFVSDWFLLSFKVHTFHKLLRPWITCFLIG